MTRRSKGKTAPKGSVLASLRVQAHSLFDPLWQSGQMSRSQAYAYLARQMGIPRERCHMKQMDEAMCTRVIHLLTLRQFDNLDEVEGA